LIEAGRGVVGVCPQTTECGPQHPIKEGGWIKKHTANWFECWCTIEDANTKQSCKLRATLRKDGKHPGGYVPFFYQNANSDEQGSMEWGKKILHENSKDYQKKLGPIIKKHWNLNLLNMVPTWRKALKKAEYGMGLKVASRGMSSHHAPLSWYKYSKDFQARLKKSQISH
jgi:hypothetical protein